MIEEYSKHFGTANVLDRIARDGSVPQDLTICSSVIEDYRELYRYKFRKSTFLSVRWRIWLAENYAPVNVCAGMLAGGIVVKNLDGVIFGGSIGWILHMLHRKSN